jgi:opacity protein-like surface antigen
MGNVRFGRAVSGVEPYLSAGAGLVRTRIGSFGELFDDVATHNGFGVNAGAGLRVGGRRMALQGDLRYVRSLTDSDLRILDDVLGDFSFWRGTLGVSFGF